MVGQCILGLSSSEEGGGSVESRRYFQCRKTVLEMLRDRGYDVPLTDLNLSLSEFRSRFGQQPNPQTLGVCVSHRSRPSNKVQVVFAGTDQIKKGTISGICDQIVDRERLTRLILIVQSKMTSFALKVLEQKPYKVEIIKLSDLLVNITNHVLQPKYEILSANEKQKLLMKYKLEDKQLPYMLRTDAIARYYGLEKGQVIKITHSADMVNSLVTYRCVL
ncbi:DNA-directed RNA polymerase V subunit 5C [Lotus japonicus]|uniref:DNA-directed RNA polymerase V subunit 5C n=1 Tax=Lotus japonicus TaxID=34305 RepID=UPI0025872279|nr:DNA-directed RNA polymerase V subunit 5C [Lotus japonicus]